MTMHKYSDLILRGALPNTIQEAQECHNTARTCKNLPQENMQVAEDNAPCHTGGVSTKTRRELNIDSIDWPAQSPDLNPIENLWALIKRDIANLPVAKSVEELEKQVKDEWWSIPQEIIQGLIDSMPERVEAVIKAKGGPTKY